jgi:hypothetical protein
VLSNLGIWQDVKTQGGMPAKLLKQTFRVNLFKGIFQQSKTTPPNMSSIDIEMQGDESNNATNNNNHLDMRMIEKLDTYAIERWESILKYIVNPKDAANQISISTKEVLKFAGLMKSINDNPDQTSSNTDDDSLILTASAFQFLLLNRKLQIWYFIIQLLEYSWQV